jgi:hypothetical protein
MSKRLLASVRFRLPEEGGRKTAPEPGLRPHIKLGHILTSCIVHATDATTVFQLGVRYHVELEIVYWREYGHLVNLGAEIQLYDGSRAIADGQFESTQ